MNYKKFSDEIWQQIEKTLQNLKSQNSAKKLIAAFDADGTLWDTDLGENFFQFQIENQCVDLPTNAFDHYTQMKKINDDPRPAYAWLAQINKGQTIDRVRTWAQQAFSEIQPPPIFSEQKKLIDLLLQNNVEVYIVTASVKWAVEPGAKALGIDHDHVIGIETHIEQNKITDEVIHPITYRSGKIESLLLKTHNVHPFLCSGNTMGDYELLQAATHLRLAVSAASRDDRLFRTEFELQEKAKEHNWINHRFI